MSLPLRLIWAKCRKRSSSLTKLSSHFGGLDIVRSNAGVVSPGHLEDVTEVSWKGVPTSRNACICSENITSQEEFNLVFSINT